MRTLSVSKLNMLFCVLMTACDMLFLFAHDSLSSLDTVTTCVLMTANEVEAL